MDSLNCELGRFSLLHFCSLAVDMDISTLQSILITKSGINNACYSQQYVAAFLKKAKSAIYVTLNNKINNFY